MASNKKEGSLEYKRLPYASRLSLLHDLMCVYVYVCVCVCVCVQWDTDEDKPNLRAQVHSSA